MRVNRRLRVPGKSKYRTPPGRKRVCDINGNCKSCKPKKQR